MNRKRITQVGIALIVIVVIMLTLHFGGHWAVDTFKEMHGM